MWRRCGEIATTGGQRVATVVRWTMSIDRSSWLPEVRGTLRVKRTGPRLRRTAKRQQLHLTLRARSRMYPTTFTGLAFIESIKRTTVTFVAASAWRRWRQ